MGNENDKVQKQYKPPAGGVQQTKIVQNSQVNSNPRTSQQPANPNNVETHVKKSDIRQQVANPRKQNPVVASTTSLAKEIEQPQVRDVKLKQSSIRIKSQKAAASVIVSSFKMQGAEEAEFKDRKVKKFNISADIPEKELIKESNYFDESNTNIGLQPKLNTRFADFSVGDFEQLSTFPVKTYLFDRALNGKLVA